MKRRHMLATPVALLEGSALPSQGPFGEIDRCEPVGMVAAGRPSGRDGEMVVEVTLPGAIHAKLKPGDTAVMWGRDGRVVEILDNGRVLIKTKMVRV